MTVVGRCPFVSQPANIGSQGSLVSPLDTMGQPLGYGLPKAALILYLASASIVFAAPLDCSSGQSNNAVFNTTVGSYDIICGVDYAGGDVAAEGGIATFGECIELCDVTPGCIDVSYGPGSGNCWMKGSIGTPVENGDIWTARSRISRAEN